MNGIEKMAIAFEQGASLLKRGNRQDLAMLLRHSTVSPTTPRARETFHRPLVQPEHRVGQHRRNDAAIVAEPLVGIIECAPNARVGIEIEPGNTHLLDSQTDGAA